MRIVSYSAGGAARLGFLEGMEVVDLESCLDRSHPHMITRVTELVDPHIYGMVKQAYEQVKGGSDKLKRIEATKVKILPPVENPSKVFWLDGNYPVHNLWEEFGLALPSDWSKWLPAMFLRPSSSAVGHESTIMIPEFVDKVWCSAEVGLVAGKTSKWIDLNEASEHILGYTVTIDMASEVPQINGRRIDQGNDKSWFSLYGKWLDDLSPIGPCFVPKEFIDIDNTRITLKVNGEIMQDFSTRDRFFSMEEILYTASSLMTINPGDIFATGSSKRKPFNLRDGDLIEAEVDGIGLLRVHMDMKKGRKP
ncbi:MAG: fumarylacetoacetate hydrolase family protein [Thaumarchaeota archaeon]|nr:fumarylacetoacetate hydrolase family protein [Nitrososphaerota archaeon]